MGWRANDGTAVVASIIGPGPNATHHRVAFRPDYGFQEAEIALIYGESERRETYLGDWHTHPNVLAIALSRKDKRTLQRIATHPAARTPEPLLVVLGGDPIHWSAQAFFGAISRTLFFTVFRARRLSLSVYERAWA